MKVMATLLLFLFPPVYLNAGAQWHYNAPIARIYPISTGASGATTILVSFMNSTNLCTATGSNLAGKYYYIKVGENSVTSDSLKNMFGVLMLAKAMGKEVNVLFDDSTSYCYIKQLVIKE
jgi:hypothetical protein